jgi:integrase
MATLEAHFDAAREPALAASQAEWSTDIAHVFWRAAKFNDLSDEVMKQRCSDVRRFMFITGVTSVTEITQAHLTHWSDTLKAFPKTFLRSEKDAFRSLKEVLKGAAGLPAGELGLSADTMRRHVKSIELLLERARAEGVILPTLDPAKVKPRKSSRKKHKARAVFRVEEARSVFRQPIWTGCKSDGRRHEPGTTVLKDGKFWIPLVIAYTGARRAEIAGMLAEDVQVIDGIPAIVIQSNRYRGIKGEPDGAPEDERRTRIVPIHSHLLELGFLEFADKAKKGHPLLFPDVVPTPRKGSRRATAADPALRVEKFGESFDDAWRKAFKLALNDNPRKLCIHSLRHYVNHTLLHTPGVHDVTRIDLLGHVQDDDEEGTNTSTYRDETPLDIKRAAIEMLPRLM